MNQFQKGAITLLVSLLLPLVVSAQDKYRAVHWDLQDGLSQAETFHIIKDVNGFLWIGTRGNLSRFDGSTFKNYYYDPNKPGSINAAFTGAGLVEDSLHNIWIGTDNGLARYDIKADTFSQFLPDSGPDSPHTVIFPMTATKDTLFALEADTVVTAYNVHTLEKTKLVTLAVSDQIGNGVSAPYSHYDARSNSLWLLSGNKQMPGGGLLRVSLTTGEKKLFEWDCYAKIKDHSHESEAMCYDRKRNCLWLNSGDGLMQFTLADNQFHYITQVNRLLVSKDYFHFVGISLDHQGRVWFAAGANKGIIIYNPSDQSMTHPFEEGSTIQTEVSDANATIYIDRDGIIWSGFWLRKGFYQIVPFSPSITRYMAEPPKPDRQRATNVINFLNIGQSKLLIGSFNGTHIFDSRTNKIQSFEEKDLPGFKGNIVVAMAADTLNKTAILLSPADAHTLYRLDLESKRCTPVTFRDTANRKIEGYHDRIRSAQHKDGNVIAFIINNREKLFIMDKDSAVAREIFSFPAERSLGFDAMGFSILGDLMFLRGGSLSQTFVYRNHKWTPETTPLDSLKWTRIAYNKKDQSYWIVIEKQLVKYNKDFKIIHTYTPKEGLPDFDIVNIIADSRGNMWLNTDRSIHQLNTETGVFSSLSEKDGFQPQGFTNGPPMHMGTDGSIYLGGGIFGEGFVRIFPEKYTNTPSSIYVQSLEVNRETLPLPTGVNYLLQLSLKYYQNQIALETGVIDYYSKGKGHIRYKMNGVNDDWQYETAGYTIRYDGLPPGEYTLLMQASNAANEFIGPTKSLLILISPPWWKTWWAYVLYTVTFASLVWSFIYYRSRELKRQNVQLEEKVLQRTNDLNRSLQDLKQTQNQLIQSEKMASLGELTAGIAHEIQNPLNFVNNFSEVSRELLEELNDAINNGSYNEVKTLSHDVRQNLEKILHHGKRADGIVKGMLQHSRASSGIKELTDVNQVVDEYLRLAYHGFRAKDKSFNANVNTAFDPSIGTVSIIPQDIGRVVLNLITNAFYTVTEKKKAGIASYEPKVTVSTKRLDSGIQISVKDNGNGIPQNILDKIFQPFFTTKPTGQGTGLGLSLSYDIVKAHGGDLKVVTKESEGSEFIISLTKDT